MNKEQDHQEIIDLTSGVCISWRFSSPFKAAAASRVFEDELRDVNVAADLDSSLAHWFVVYPCSRFGEYEIYSNGHWYGSFRLKGNTLVGRELTCRIDDDGTCPALRIRELLVHGVSRVKRFLQERSCVKGGDSVALLQEVPRGTAFLSALLAALP